MSNRNNRKSGSSRPQLRVTRRILSVKRHTEAYVINGETVSVRQAARLASQGRLMNCRRVANHIQANVGSRRLSLLPAEIRR